MRGSSSANVRGSAHTRRQRRRWLIRTRSSPSGKTIACNWCGKLMRTATPTRPLGTFEVDRWSLCGHDGGRYVKGNVVPSCARCNATRCGNQHKGCRGRAPRKRR